MNAKNKNVCFVAVDAADNKKKFDAAVAAAKFWFRAMAADWVDANGNPVAAKV